MLVKGKCLSNVKSEQLEEAVRYRKRKLDTALVSQGKINEQNV